METVEAKEEFGDLTLSKGEQFLVITIRDGELLYTVNRLSNMEVVFFIERLKNLIVNEELEDDGEQVHVEE